MDHVTFIEGLRTERFHEHATIAITAAVFARQWGDDAAVKFATKRRCPMRLVKLAMALERDTHNELYSHNPDYWNSWS